MIKRGMLIIILLVIFSYNVYAAELVGYWKLDEIKNGVYEDSSTNLYHGIVAGNPIIVEGIRGNALQFGGNDAVLLNIVKVNKEPGTKVTVEFWMHWGLGNDPTPIMPFGFEGYDLYFHVPENKPYFGFNTASSDLFGVDATNMDNKWIYVVAEFNNGDAKLSKLYLDGVEQQLEQPYGTTGNKQTSQYASISGWRNDASYRFIGKLDEVKIYNGVFTAEEIKAKYDTYQSGLLAHWSFDEGSGTIASDSSGNGNNGNLINNPTWTDGIKGKSLEFDGTNKYANMPLVTTKTKDVSIEAWVYSKKDSQRGNIAYVGYSGGNGYGLEISNSGCSAGSKVAVIAHNVACDLVGANYVLPTNEWIHLVLTSEGNNWKLYANGELKKSTVSSQPLTPTESITIGGGVGGNAIFTGLVDEVKIYNRPLTADEILQSYQNLLPQQPTCETSCYWKVGEQTTGGESKISVENATTVQAKANCIKDSYGNILTDNAQVNFIFYEDDILFGDELKQQPANVLSGNLVLDFTAVYEEEGDSDNELFFKVKDLSNNLLCSSGTENNQLLYVKEPLECQTDEDCATGEVCEANECVLAPVPSCSETALCSPGEECVGGQCVPQLIQDCNVLGCPAGQTCDILSGSCIDEQPPEEPPQGPSEPEFQKTEAAEFVPAMGTKELLFPVPKKYTVSSSNLENGLFNKLESIDIFPAYEIEGQTKYCDTPYTYNID